MTHTSQKLAAVMGSLAILLVQTAATARSESQAQCVHQNGEEAAVVERAAGESVTAGGQVDVEIVGPTARGVRALPQDGTEPRGGDPPQDVIIPLGTGVDAEAYAARKAAAANSTQTPCPTNPLPQAPANPATSSPESGEPGLVLDSGDGGPGAP